MENWNLKSNNTGHFRLQRFTTWGDGLAHTALAGCGGEAVTLTLGVQTGDSWSWIGS